MARLSTTGSVSTDTTTINLTRLLTRLQKTVLKPDNAAEQRLRTSIYERNKVATNIDYAKTLLLRLEQDSSTIKVQTKKQEVQADLIRKRNIILQLSERLTELELLQDANEDTSEGEDLLGEDTPSDDFSEDNNLLEPPTLPREDTLNKSFDAEPTIPRSSDHDLLFPSSLRARHAMASDSFQANDTAHSTSADTTAQTEHLLTHNRTEQESLTNSLLAMAQALKASSRSFADSLESEKDVLGRAGEGLDRNTTGMEAAQKRMGYLRRMSEGKGWWGRMVMYGWIFGLMVVAFSIVAFLPKLRF